MSEGIPRTQASIRSPWVGERWQHLLITDVDNTLFDFGLYAEAGLQALLPAARRLLGLAYDDAIAEIREAHTFYNSVEMPFAYELLPSMASRHDADRHRISRQLADAFWTGASQGMAPYPGVASTMNHLWRNGTAIVAVSDGPMREVWRKLRRLGLLQYVAGIVAVGNLRRRREPILQPSDVTDYIDPHRSRSRFYQLLGHEDRKPSPLAYQHVLREVPMSLSRVTVVGDSPLKDLQPAREIGIPHLYWAKYGERNRHLEPLLQSVTPFEPPEAVQSQKSAARGFRTLEHFEQLETLISMPQSRLPLSP